MIMNSTIATSSSSSSSFFHFKKLSIAPSNAPSFLQVTNPKPLNPLSFSATRIRASSSSNLNTSPTNPIIQNLKSFAGAAVLIGAAAAATFFGGFDRSLAMAEPPVALTEEAPTVEDDKEEQTSPLSEFLESSEEAIEALKSLLRQKLENGEDEEALKILKRLVSAQPSVAEWKFLMARLLNEMGDTQKARNAFEEILKINPLSFEALFENALLMDRCGEGEAVITRLEEALKIAEEENKEKEARDVRLIMAQIKFLQKNVEEALKSYQELAKEDPNDFRPYFCLGMIYSLLDKNAEAKEQFAKYRELSPKKFEVEGFLRTPLSRMKLFGTNEEN